MSSTSQGAPAEARRGRPRDAAKDAAILAAATRLFLERGFEAVSMDSVAAAAGVSKATIYARYPDKEALFSEVLRIRCAGSLEPGALMSGGDREPRAVLTSLARRFLGLILDPQTVALFRVLVAEAERAPKASELFFRNSIGRVTQMLADWLAGETERGRLRVQDPQDAAWSYLGAVKGEAHMRATIGLAPLSTEQLEAHIERCADDFLRAHAAPDVRP